MNYVSFLLLIVGGYEASAEFVQGAKSDPKRELVSYGDLKKFHESQPTMYPTAAAPTPYPVEIYPTEEPVPTEEYPVASPPTNSPTEAPIIPGAPTKFPTKPPTPFPTRGEPSEAPTSPTASPSMDPTNAPTNAPTISETSSVATPAPSSRPSDETNNPTTATPTTSPSEVPSEFPSEVPTSTDEPSETFSPNDFDSSDSDEGDTVEGRGRFDDRDSLESTVESEPELMTILEIICDEDNAYLWGTLCVILGEGKAFGFLDNAEDQYTLFAPTNEAFENSDYPLDSLLQNESAIQILLSIHITHRVLPYDGLVCNSNIEMLNFYFTYSLCIGTKKVQIADGNELRNLPIIDEPSDIKAKNGIIHPVNNLIIPSEFSLDIDFFEGFFGYNTHDEISDDHDAMVNTSENFIVSDVLGEDSTLSDSENITTSENITVRDILDDDSTLSDTKNITTSDALDEDSTQSDSKNITDSDALNGNLTQSDIDDLAVDATVGDGTITLGEVMNAISDFIENRKAFGPQENEEKCEVCQRRELCAVPGTASVLFPGEGVVSCADVIRRQNSPKGIVLGPSMCKALQQRFEEYCLIGK